MSLGCRRWLFRLRLATSGDFALGFEWLSLSKVGGPSGPGGRAQQGAIDPLRAERARCGARPRPPRTKPPLAAGLIPWSTQGAGAPCFSFRDKGPAQISRRPATPSARPWPAARRWRHRVPWRFAAFHCLSAWVEWSALAEILRRGGTLGRAGPGRRAFAA